MEIVFELVTLFVVVTGACYKYGEHIKADMKEYIEGRYVEEKDFSEVKQILSGMDTSIRHILSSINKLEKAQNVGRG